MGMKYKDPETGQLKELSLKASDTLPIGTIVDYDGEEVPDGWEEVEEEKDVYSTEEVKTNKVWIDGKPIYRKVLIFNKSVLNIGITDLNHNIVNFNSIINVKGFLTRIQSKVYNVIPWNSSENWKIIIGDITENAITITIGEGLYTNIKDVILIIEYTKTTD